MTDSADNAVTKNQCDLKDAIVSSGLFDIINECEQKEFITSAVKNTLTCDSTNQTADKRAYGLIDNIKRSLRFESVAQTTLDDFLCILYRRGNLGAKVVAERIANEYKGHLPEYRKLSVPSSGTNQTHSHQEQHTALSQSQVNEQPECTKKDDLELFAYPMSSKPHGLALIVNNVTWINDPTGKETRHGSDADADRLQTVFANLDYHVKLRRNLKAAEMKTALEEIRKDIRDSHDSFVCCILSHGTDEGIEGVDGKYVTVHELAETLYPDKCGALNDKPKLFFIEACREKIQNDNRGVNDTVTKPLPRGADFFFGNSTIQDSAAYRKQRSGSFYIQALCETFEQHADKLSFSDMLLAVNQKIATNPELSQHCGGKKPQMSETVNTLRGNIYFNKKP